MKYIVSVFSFFICSFACIGWVNSFGIEDTIEFPYKETVNDDAGTDAVDVGEALKKAAIDDEKGVVQRIMDAFGINYFKTEGTEQTATFYVKEVINWLLAIMGLIALISVLRGFYKMLLSKDSEEGFTSAKKIVLNAFLAIIIIGVSWFLVSWFFKIYSLTLGTTVG